MRISCFWLRDKQKDRGNRYFTVKTFPYIVIDTILDEDDTLYFDVPLFIFEQVL